MLLLCALIVGSGSVWATDVTVSMTSFETISGNVGGDANISYEAAKGTAGTAPAVNSSQIRVYQNGGTFTVTANNGCKIKSVTLGSAMKTTVTYSIDGGTASSNQSITANGTTTVSNVDCTSVLFTCTGTDKNSRLYVNSLSVTYTPATVSVTGVTLNKSTLSLVEGESETLTATVSPDNATNKEVTWSSNDDDVATVNSSTGEVTAVAEGVATITATTTDGGKTATCTVTVTSASAPNATISTSSLAFGDVEVGQTKNLTFTITPANLTGALTIASNNVKYSVSPASIAQDVTEATTITVTAAPTASDDDMDGTITVSGGGITAQTVTLSATPYVASAVSLVASPVGAGTFTYNETTVTSINTKVGANATIKAVAATGYKFTGWTVTGATPASSENAEETFTFTGANPVLTATFEIDPTITYDFSQIDGFASWGTGYSNHEVTYTDAVVNFTSYNHQTSTITDVPVSKGGNVTLTLRNAGETLKSAKFVCKQWGSKAQTITLKYSTDGGDTFSNLSPSVTSTNFTIESDNLPTGTNAVQITFNNSSNQVGVASATIEINRVAEMTITSAGYATFSNASEVAIPEGVTAYYAVAKDESTITLKEITGGYIPAEEGVVIAGTAKTYYATKTATSAAKISGNLLKPWLEDGEPEDDEYYTLAAGPTFKQSTGGELAGGKAYLVLPSGSARILAVEFDGTTGINTVGNAMLNIESYYNLNGQRIAQPTKGLYIVNGKKVVIR